MTPGGIHVEDEAKQNLTALHPLSESCWDSQTSLHDDESADVTRGEELFRAQPPRFAHVSPGPPCAGKSRGFQRGCRPEGGKSFAALCSVSQNRLSLPAASCHAPVAPDCLIGTFQVLNVSEEQECSYGKAGGKKINDERLCFFRGAHFPGVA
ncbi:hypothetical protein Q5P01_022569 [Channa striata]|uniref:Uncharacterized protein n=1 Tax=Channa striata TaxID=64152 RepID=A0AA88IYL3_CHASR|nr:hypothetical protein Q5P01_022569 [Channa striata]